MFEKNQYTWDRSTNYTTVDLFKPFLNKIKTYSKSFNSSTYSVTSDLTDIYQNIKFQHTFWIQLTDIASDSILLLNMTFKKGEFYNLLKYFDTETLLNSIELKNYLTLGWIKASNSKLFDDIKNPTRKDWFCFYQPSLINQYITEPFDYLVVSYNIKDSQSQDIDTRTAIVNSNYQHYYTKDNVIYNSLSFPLDGNDVGADRGTKISSTSGNVYLMWGGDNTTSIGGESVLINFKDIKNDLSYLESIEIRLRAYFYTTIASGLIQLKLTTYKGGVMSNVGLGFINTGGNLIQTITSNRKLYTQTSTNYDGDDIGTIIIDIANSNAILTDVLNTSINSQNLTFSDLLNTLDFNKFVWDMGTSGYLPDNTNYTDMLFNNNFTETDLTNIFQNNNDLGYTEQTVFTSDKVFKKLLNNFNIIDVATTSNIPLYDINNNPIPYQILNIDGITVKEGLKFLFKDQINSYENGIYNYSSSGGGIFKRDKIFDNDSDLKYFSCFIKEGIVNSNLEFFLNRKENGEYPSFNADTCGCKCNCLDSNICETFTFSLGNNYVVRNRSTYSLLQDHVFTSSNYFVQQEPITDFDYTDRYFNNGTNFNINIGIVNDLSYFNVSSDFKKFEFYNNSNLYFSNNAGINAKDTLNPRIENINNTLYLIRNENELVTFDKFTSILNKDIFKQKIVFSTNYSDFQLLSSTQGLFLENSMGSTSGFSVLDNISFDNGINIINSYILNANAREFQKLNEFIFYTTTDGIYINYNSKNYLVRSKAYPNKLRVIEVNSIITLSYLFNETPEILSISESQLIQLLSWNKNLDYPIIKFSKKTIGDWNLVSTNGTNNLYLKNNQITNLNGTEYFKNVPKILDSNSRYFDGVKNFIDFNSIYDYTLNKPIFNKNISLTTLQDIAVSNGSVTIEFIINPNEIRVNQTPIYFGDKSSTYIYNLGGINYNTPINPVNYITFYLDNGNGFPAFIINEGSKQIVISSNQSLNIGVDTHISFVWDYSLNKADGVLYFNGVAVGNYVDQQTSSNTPIDIRTFSYDSNLLGKSEIVTNPLYKGFIKEVRLWNIAFNSSEIFVRLNLDINKNNENNIINLIGYWKLNDEFSIIYNLAQGNNFYKASTELLSEIGSGIFNGGLYNDISLSEIQNPLSLQLSNDYLYVLDSKKYELYTNKLNNLSSLNIFNNKGTSGVLFLPDPTISSNNVIYIDTTTYKLQSNLTTSNRWGVLQNISSGDILDISVETYYSNPTGSNSTGGSLSVLYGTNFILNNSIGVWSTSSNVWTTLNIKYEAKNNINQIGFQLQVDTNNSYFRNLNYKITRKNKVYNIYTINLLEESITRIRNSYDISSIYLDLNNSNFYSLENSNIYEYSNNIINNIPVNYLANNIAKDFSVVNNNYFYLDNYNNIWEGTNSLVYTSTSNNIETIYGINDVSINETILYYKNKNSNIDVLARNINSNNSLNFIGTYPLPTNNSVLFGTNSIINIVNNNVYLNNDILDINNYYWNFNLKEILGVFKKNDIYVLILSKTLLNQIQLWLVNTSTLEITKISNYLNEQTLFISTNSNITLQYYIINKNIPNNPNIFDEWIVINDNFNLHFYQLEKGNKINYKKCEFILNIESSLIINNIQLLNNTDIIISSSSGNINYISTISNISNNYNLFSDITQFNSIENGWVIGDNGIVFEDISASNGTSFNLSFNNIVYKDDLYDIDSIITTSKRSNGYQVDIWSGIVYMVGATGRIIKTIDNGTSWQILKTNNYNNLNGVSFYDINNGLIVGSNNTILATFTGGSSFMEIQLPITGNYDFYDVNFYAPDKALIVGTLGIILHLTLIKNSWRFDKILNNTQLLTLATPILSSNLDDNIKLIINNGSDTDIYRQTIRKMDYLGNDNFLLVGDNNLISYLKISKQIDYVASYPNFLKNDLISGNWNSVLAYDDIVKNEKRAFISTNNQIYSFEWNRFEQSTINSSIVNITNIELDLFTESSNTINTLALGNNSLIYGGSEVSSTKKLLFELNDNTYKLVNFVSNNTFNSNQDWNLNGTNSWIFNNKASVYLPNISESSLLYTEINLPLNTDIIFNINFEIPSGSNTIEIVYANSLVNLLSGNYLYNNTYLFPISQFTLNNTSGITHIGFIAHSNGINSTSSFIINNVSIYYNEYFYNSNITYSSSNYSVDLTKNFIPKILFLDYYLGRKINTLLEDGSFITPSGILNKNKLQCFYFRNSEYIEFSDYGTVDSQNNYLAYQDHSIINRRTIGQPNSWGKTQLPYNKYNKRITSIDTYLRDSVWVGEISTEGTNSNSNGYLFTNTGISNPTYYNITVVFESSNTTKLRLAWNKLDSSYSTSGLVSKSLYIFSDYIIDYNVNRYTFVTSKFLGLNTGNLIKLDFSDTLYYVISEYVSNNIVYLEVDGTTIPTSNYTGNITKVLINFIENTNIGDVINITALNNVRNTTLNVGQQLYLEIIADTLSITSIASVEYLNNNLFNINFLLPDYNTNINLQFGIDSTIDEILLSLQENNSEAVQLATQLLEQRCLPIGTGSVQIDELNVYNFLTNYKNITDIALNTDNNFMYLITSDKYLFVINIYENNVELIINLSTSSKYITYNPYFKYMYITGGDITNPTIDIINCITNTKISSLNIGSVSLKPLYNPFNRLMYIPTGNTCLLYNGITHSDTINLEIIDLVFVSFNNLIYTISIDSNLRIYNGSTLINTINIGNGLLNIYYNFDDNTIYITSFNGIYTFNIINNLVDFISVPQGILNKSLEFVTINSGNSSKKIILISNANNTNTNFFITVIDRNTLTIIKEIYTNISVSDIKYNVSENLIYLSGYNGQILIIKPIFDVITMDIDLDINTFNIQSGYINSLFYNELNYRIYPLKSKTFEISYLLTDNLEPSNIQVNLNTLVSDITSVVRDITPDNTLSLWDLLPSEMIYEINSPNIKLIVKNLNYFDGDLATLKSNFDKHLLGESYNLIIDEPNYIHVKGNVNDSTKYYNLESFIKYATFGTNSQLNIETIPVKYDNSVVYGANYSLLSFLKKLNPLVFTDNYSFNLPIYSYNYQPLYRTINGNFEEFTISGNTIYVGNDLITILKFKQGTFIDITSISKSLKRIYIVSIEKTYYSQYPNEIRWIITTDKILDTNLDLMGVITIRTRDLLSEISMDLEFTDNIMLPISNNGSNSVSLSNNTYFNNQISSYQYSKIILNDDNIRKYVSAVIHLDSEMDLNISVINWKDDPNFFFRPQELFQVGIDSVLKKSITIDSSNYLTKGNTLSLTNVDFNKYNYIITDGMTLKDFESEFYWVLNADIRNAILGKDINGLVWYQGDWISGTWEDGTWYSGVAYDIEWIKGNVYSDTIINNFNIYSAKNTNNKSNTIWYNAIWNNGTWNNGTWNNGTWNNGSFNGTWNNGTWVTGIWNGGKFNGGIWNNGTWLSGTFGQSISTSTWESGTWLGGDFESGIWKNGIFDQTSRVVSRFGTKASLLNPAIWEYGWWKNGEFHSGLNIDSKGNTLPSLNYKYSNWYNGTWEQGIFYGGQWEMGVWNNGIWNNGYLKSNLTIKEWRVRTTNVGIVGKDVEVEFNSKHYSINIDSSGNPILLNNHFVLLGEPEILNGKIHPNTELLGYNTSAGIHQIIEIIDEYTVLINIPNNNYPYELINGTSGYLNTINTTFNAGTNYLIDTLNYSNIFGTNKERLILANNNLTILETNANIVSDYTWGSKNPDITYLSVSKPADIYYHKKSNKTFITSGYDNSLNITNTKLSVYDGIFLIKTIPLIGANFISYDNVYDSLIITPRCLIDSSTSGNGNIIYIINPYNYNTFSFNLSTINMDIVSKAVIAKPYVQDGTSYFSIKYEDSITTNNKSALFRIDNNTKTISNIIMNSNNTTELEGWDSNRNKIILKNVNSTSSNIELFEIDVLFNNKKLILNSTGILFSKFIINTNELFIINNNILYTWDGKLNLIINFTHNINSIIWSKNFNTYFIACTDGVYVLDKNKKSIIYKYNILDGLDFTQNDTGDIIYVATSNKLYLIMNDICPNNCLDYSVFVPVLSESISYNTNSFQYVGTPHVATHWINGTFNRGIWNYGFWENGQWQGGIWINGVFENGLFGT